MKNKIQSGKVLAVIAPYNVSSGAGVLVGSIFGVAANDAAQGTPVEIDRTGVYSLTANTADTGAVGVKMYWDNTARRLTTTATSNTLVGALAAEKSGMDTVASVLLDGVVR